MITHNGIEFFHDRNFGTDIYVHILDLNAIQMKLTRGFRTVPEAVTAFRAKVGFNGGGWEEDHPYHPNEYLIIEGEPISIRALDFRPCIEVTRDNKIVFHENQPSFRKSWNVWGFDRLIAKDGKFNPKITDNFPDPRTVYGADELGRLVVMVCDGRQVDQKGLTFRECWSVMQSYGVITCGNADGGYSSAAVNTAFSPSLLNSTYLVENRPVVHQVLFHAKEFTMENAISLALDDAILV
jgi:hypothetical protein